MHFLAIRELKHTNSNMRYQKSVIFVGLVGTKILAKDNVKTLKSVAARS